MQRELPEGYRVFQAENGWHFEPVDYEGDVLYSVRFGSAKAATRAAWKWVNAELCY